ncbi:hypothetical protein [Paenibacillus thermotolerans]|uniref:hypothetical protein n=1 Tax=Paenibacillus thermotolerans TaxID=3027807 RepID=UPI0023678FCD|nr:MULTISPECIES: hypothetical protein [unclassified Paenibacillus]
MSSSGPLITFIIVSFCLAGIVILRRESIPQPMRKYLAIFSLFMISASFIMLTYTFFTAGR